jgi:hypothetical protein
MSEQITEVTTAIASPEREFLAAVVSISNRNNQQESNMIAIARGSVTEPQRLGKVDKSSGRR